MSQTHLRIFSVSRYFDLDYGTDHVITPLAWQHSGGICQCLLLLLTPTGAHWHWVTSRGRSRRWGGLRLRAPCHNRERDGRCVRQIRTPRPRYLSLDSYPRADHTFHIWICITNNNIKIKQYCVWKVFDAPRFFSDGDLWNVGKLDSQRNNMATIYIPPLCLLEYKRID